MDQWSWSRSKQFDTDIDQCPDLDSNSLALVLTNGPDLHTNSLTLIWTNGSDQDPV